MKFKMAEEPLLSDSATCAGSIDKNKDAIIIM